MRSVVRWAIGNSPAMNTLLIVILAVGGFSLVKMRREVFPEFELEIVLVSVPYPGASPQEVEEGICQKIEEAVRSVDGVKKKTAVAKEGGGFLVLELEAGSNVQKILNEVRSEIDSIPSFPELAEEPDVQQVTFRIPAITVGVIANESTSPDARLRLREVTEKVRDKLVELPKVSQATLLGARPYQIDVEISEEKLREYGITLREVAQIIRRENVELPAGTMQTTAQEVRMRGKNKFVTGQEIAKLPLITSKSGDVLTIGEVGDVKDEFTDDTFACMVDGQPGLMISVERTKTEDLLAMVAEVRQFVEDSQNDPELYGYTLRYWGDQSLDVADRMYMLIRNGIQGLVLVFVVLAIFLELRLAFWVALGIPIAIFGAGAVLLETGETLNMLSMFAFLMALGIVVDDAIVIGENIYKHREMDKPYVQAAIDGTVEVIPSVAASVSTTIIAFLPLMFVSGVMGKFIAVMPVAVIAMLIISLIESTFILPCHLAHKDGLFFRVLGVLLYPLKSFGVVFSWLNEKSQQGVDWFVQSVYLPMLRFCLKNWPTTLAASIGLLAASGGFILAGITPFVLMPKMDNRQISARVTYPEGTPKEITQATIDKLEELVNQIGREASEQAGGEKVILTRSRILGWQDASQNGPAVGGDSAGGNLGVVQVELVAPEDREVTSEQILARWRARWEEKYADRFPGAESLTFASQAMGPGGIPIEFKLLSDEDAASVAQLEQAVEECKAKLATYQGVKDVEDDSRPGKWEYQIRVKEKAKAMGVTVADLAETVRSAYYGEEVMRLQRGRHEVKLMVRYPKDERETLNAFDDIRVRLNDGAERPLTELADITVARGPAEINRIDQKRSITVLADVDKAQGGNAAQVVADLQANYIDELLAKYPAVSVRWEGQQEQSRESIQSMIIGFGVAMLGMFALLTLQFRSYFQPLMILAIVPFGIVGAILGHALMGLDFTLFSFFGMIALTGVVVNDSIVLIDFINKETRAGIPLDDALILAGQRRFRPVMLTSITTIAGLTPMLLETSFQAQVLIPMATSLCFGLLVGTLLILILIPTYYRVYGLMIGDLVHLDTADVAASPEESEGSDQQGPSLAQPVA